MENVKLDLLPLYIVAVTAVAILCLGIWRVRLVLGYAATHVQDNFELLIIQKQVRQIFFGLVLILLSVPILIVAMALSNYHSLSVFLSVTSSLSGGKESAIASAYFRYSAFCMMGGILAWTFGSAMLVWPVLYRRTARPGAEPSVSGA